MWGERQTNCGNVVGTQHVPIEVEWRQGIRNYDQRWDGERKVEIL